MFQPTVPLSLKPKDVPATNAPTQNAEPVVTVGERKAERKKEHSRSPGLRIVDVWLYPVINNIGVFVLSVGATYLTSRGGDKDAAGNLLHGKTGEFFHKRGNWLVKKFKSTGMSDNSADMSKMVAFSFIDGSLLAPVIKLIEDRREKCGRWIDKKLGTTPDDPDVYDREPKQTWTSVMGGRAGTALVVVNTAVALDKTGLNDKLFREPGETIGKKLENMPKVKKFFGKYDVGELAKISLFEGFYTSVCTAGLYFSSRLIARKLNKHDEQHKAASHPQVEDGTYMAINTQSNQDSTDTKDSDNKQPGFASDSLRKPRQITQAPASFAQRAQVQTGSPTLSV